MSEQITGKIDSIFTKEVNTKFGPKAVYHAMINGHDVNLGFKTECVEGEQVTLNVEHKYGGYQLLQGAPSGTPTAVGPAGSAPSAAAPARASKGAFPVEPNANGTSIVRQSSLNRAVEVIAMLISSGIFSPKSEDEYMAKLFDLAYTFTDFGTGQREAKAAAAQAAYDGTE
jgi:hypothetical protein